MLMLLLLFIYFFSLRVFVFVCEFSVYSYFFISGCPLDYEQLYSKC